MKRCFVVPLGALAAAISGLGTMGYLMRHAELNSQDQVILFAALFVVLFVLVIACTAWAAKWFQLNEEREASAQRRRDRDRQKLQCIIDTPYGSKSVRIEGY